MTETNKTHNPQTDWQMYQAFLKACREGENLESDPLYKLTDKISKVLSKSFNRPDDASDLRQICLMALTKEQYKRGKSLSAYVWKIMLNQLRQWRRKEGKMKLRSIDEALENNLIDQRTADISDKVIRRISSEEHMAKLLENCPELEKKIIGVIARYENKENKPPSERAIVTGVQKNSKDKISAHKIKTTYKKIKDDYKRKYPDKS